MLTVSQLIKLYTRSRFTKLLQEGMKFLEVNKDKLPPKMDTNINICNNFNYKVSFNFRTFTCTITTRDCFGGEVITKIPYSQFDWKEIRRYEIESFAKTVGEMIFLFVPKEDLTVTLILHCNNSTIQSRMIQTYGAKEFFVKLNAITVHKDGENELLRVDLGFRAEIMMVKVVDTTTKQIYLLRVPPEIEIKPRTLKTRAVMIPMRTCKQAIAWTFGLKTAEYHPDGES